MKRYRVLTANDVYKADASGSVSAVPVGTVIEHPDGPHADRLVAAGFVELVVEPVAPVTKRRTDD